MSRPSSQAGSRPSSRGNGGGGSTPDVSSLEYDAQGTQPQNLQPPFNTHITSKLGKVWKASFAGVKKALIKGQPHPSSTAPEQGNVVSVRLFNAAGKKVVETIHVLYDGTWVAGKEYYKKKRAGGS